MKIMEKKFWSLVSFILRKFSMLLFNDLHGSHIGMFHDVKIDNIKTDNDFDCHISDLLDYINYCLESNLRFVSLDDLLGQKKQNAVKDNAVLTFDDGFESVFTIVFPKLKELNIPFIVYITIEFIGKRNYLSKEQILELSKNELCTIGMHASEHKMFRYETRIVLNNDFEYCKSTIEEIIGITPKHFAFPYGSIYAVSKNNIRLVRSKGVKSVVLTEQRELTKRDIQHPFTLPRINIPGYYNGTAKTKFRGVYVRK